MSVKYQRDGHARSERTREESLEMLKSELRSLSNEERAALYAALDEMTGDGDPQLYTAMEDREWAQRPVDIYRFVDDPYYLGNTCDTLYPKWREDLYELFADGTYREAIFTGSIGSGKTFAASIGVCYMLHRLGCMRDPHRSFGIAANSNISLVCLSVNEVLATKVAYENIATKIEASPWFQEHFPFTKTKKELRFPKKIWVAARATTDGSVLGLNVIGGLLDECLAEGTKVLLWDGEAVAVEELVGQSDVVVETFDFEKNEAVPAVAYVKRSADQECFEFITDDGLSLGVSGDHPIAVLDRSGELVFKSAMDVAVGDEVVSYGEMDRREAESALQEDERAMGLGSLRESRDESGRSVSSDSGGKEGSSRRTCLRVAGFERKSQSDVWDEAVRRAKEAYIRDQQGQKAYRAGSETHVRAEAGEENSYSSLQGRAIGKESGAQGGIPTHRGSEAEDFSIQYMEDAQGRLEILRSGGYHQSRVRRVPKSVRVTRYRDVGAGYVCDEVRIREARGLLLVERSDAPNGSGLPGMGFAYLCGGGEAERVHLQRERESKNERRSKLLRGARLGIRGVGRTLAVARVVSKRSVGVLPTYDVSVPGYECYIADGKLVHNTNFMKKAKSKDDKRFDIEGQAGVLYNAMQRRMKSRFERRGQLPGMLFVVSSKQTQDDFTAKRIRESKNDPTVFVRDYCLTGDTKIPLLDGTEATLEELVARYGDSEEIFDVYSFDIERGRIVPGKAHHPRLTARQEEILEIELDNGEVIRATPWHPFLLKSGEYVRASELREGDSLMPLYRQKSEKGYEEVGQPWWSGRWQKTHHMVAVAAYGAWPKRGLDGKPTVVHHKNFHKSDNRPENLQVMEWDEHRALHTENMETLSRYVKSDKHRKWASEHMAALHKDSEFAAARDARSRKVMLELRSDQELMDRVNRNNGERLAKFHKTAKGRALQAERSKKYWKGRKKITSLDEVVESAKRGDSITALAARFDCSPSSICCALKAAGLPKFSEIKQQAGHFSQSNHKVVSIRDGGRADVYDLSVDTYENFALSAGVFVHNSVWEPKPKDHFNGEWFNVLVGNESSPSRILNSDEDPNKVRGKMGDGCVLIEVPVEYKTDFEKDLEGSIRDLAGVATVAVSPYIAHREKISECINHARQHPFSRESYDPSQRGDFLWNKMVAQAVERDYGDTFSSTFRPILNPHAPRHVHIDPSSTTDCTGFCMAHIGGWVDVKRRLEDGSHFAERAPVIVVDLILRIVPPTGDEIQMGDLRRLVYKLVEKGYMVTKVTMDSWNTLEMIQKLQQKGYNAEVLSVDRTMSPYECLKNAIYENRLDVYDYPVLIRELRELEHDRVKRKVDHPARGCFVGETRIPLLDGTFPQISELAGKEAWVYSVKSDGTIVPGKARGRLTKYTAELVDVVLDNGAVERCTPDHLWMLRNGEYKEAKDLRPGVDRLMPIKRGWPVNGGYERVVNNRGQRQLTHHMVVCAQEGLDSIPKGECVHHLNHDKTDNRPENLERVCLREHARAHTTLRHGTDPEWRSKLYEGARKFNESDEGRRKHSEAMKRTQAATSTAEHKRRARKRSHFRSDITIDSLLSVMGHDDVANANAAARSLGCGRNVVVRVLHNHGYSSWQELETQQGQNHKVRAVIPVSLDVAVPVYDLEVDEFSNFALCSGVFVHNSKDTSDALAGVCFSLTENSLRQPIPMLRRAPMYSGDVWMQEQMHHAAAAQAANDLEDLGPAPKGPGQLPPFLGGTDVDYGWKK